MSILLAPALRKSLVEVFANIILPALQAAEDVPILLVDMPLHLPKNIEVEHLDVPLLPDINFSDNDSVATMKLWPSERMNSVSCPYIAFIFDGEADLRVGTTVNMAATASAECSGTDWVRCGQHILRLKSPAVLIFPPHIPMSDGSRPHWEASRHEPAHSQILWLHIMADRVLCHVCTSEREVHTTHHPLHVSDVHISHLVDALQDELKEYSLHHERVARSVLQALILRLHRQVALHDPVIADTVWVSSSSLLRTDCPIRLKPVVEEAVTFIHSHLHKSIKVGQVAAHCELSSRQISRHFRSAFGMTVKEYVNRQKITAAQQMLARSDMGSKEISTMLGFSQTSHFCNLFRRYTKLSPGNFREHSVSATLSEADPASDTQ